MKRFVEFIDWLVHNSNEQMQLHERNMVNHAASGRKDTLWDIPTVIIFFFRSFSMLPALIHLEFCSRIPSNVLKQAPHSSPFFQRQYGQGCLELWDISLSAMFAILRSGVNANVPGFKSNFSKNNLRRESYFSFMPGITASRMTGLTPVCRNVGILWMPSAYFRRLCSSSTQYQCGN